jgi:hypothetical protein
MHHYVYKITVGSGFYYLGVRSCKLPPEQDSYMGSGMAIICRMNGSLSKEILGVFPSRDAAEDFESALLAAHVGLDRCLNRKKRTRRISHVQ